MERERRSPSHSFAATVFLSLVAVGFATAIFAIDTFTPLGLAVAVLYVVVVLMAGRFLDRRGVFVVAVACVTLTIVSYLLQHGLTYGPSLARCLVSLLAIVITTFLALKSQAATLMLHEQASLLDITHDAIIARDLNDVITYWNRGAEQLYGWSREEALGKTPHELAPHCLPDAAEGDQVDAALDRPMGRRARPHQAGRQRGRRRQPLVRAAGRGRTPGRHVGDQQRHHQAQDRRSRSLRQEKELQLTIDTIPAFVFRILPDGWTDFLNKRWLDFTGLTHSEAEGLGWRVVYHPDDVEHIVESRRQGMASGQPWESEGRIRSADGQYRWFLNRAAPLRDEHGNIVKWYGSNTDIEDRKRAENALRRSEANLADAQRLSKTGSFAWDVTSGKVRWSEEAYRIFEHDPKVEPTVELVKARTHPDDRPSLIAILEGVMRERRQNWELEHRHRDAGRHDQDTSTSWRTPVRQWTNWNMSARSWMSPPKSTPRRLYSRRKLSLLT